MILSLGQGEPSYVPDGLMGQARDYADVSYLAFLQCYARDLSRWEIICFFAAHQEDWCQLESIADALDRSINEVAEQLGRLAAAGLLDERVVTTGIEYCLTRKPQLRRQVARLGSDWRCLAARLG